SSPTGIARFYQVRSWHLPHSRKRSQPMNIQRALPFILSVQVLLLLAVLITGSPIIVGACLVITLGLLVLLWPQPKPQAPRDPEIHDPDQVILWKTRMLDVVQ